MRHRDRYGNIQILGVVALGRHCSKAVLGIVKGDYVGFNTGTELQQSKARSGLLLGCSLVSLHFWF